jgi:hypothetical protein
VIFFLFFGGFFFFRKSSMQKCENWAAFTIWVNFDLHEPHSKTMIFPNHKIQFNEENISLNYKNWQIF